jgi:PAS domain S-box-containing protein
MDTLVQPRRPPAARFVDWFRRRGFATQVLVIHAATLAAVLVALGVVSFGYVESAMHQVAGEISLSRLRGLALDLGGLPRSEFEAAAQRQSLQNHLEAPTYVNAVVLSAQGETRVVRSDGDPPALPLDTASGAALRPGWRMVDGTHMRSWVPLPRGDGLLAATVSLRPADTTVRYVVGVLVVLFVAISLSGGLVFGLLMRRHARGLERLVGWARERATHLEAPAQAPPERAVGSRELRALAHALSEVVAQRTHQLRAKEQALRTLGRVIDAMPEAVLVYDVTGTVRICNEAMQRQFGWRGEQLVGGRLDRIIPPGERYDFMRTMLDFAAHGAGQRTRLMLDRSILCADGSAATVRLYGELMKLPHGPKMCLFLRDMTQELRDARALEAALAEAQQSAQVKSRFLANMSHEIRTPLNGIAGMLDLLTRSSPTPDQREYIDVMRSSARLLRNLLNDILDLSKIEAGRLELESLPFDLEEQLHDACVPFKALAESRGLRFEARFHVGHPVLLGDPFRITQILNNLLDNAIKFTTSGGVRVEVAESRDPRAPDGSRIRISITDTGVGIPKALQKRLFAAFTQADESVTRRYGGTGLGLALCRQLARMMGGDIQVESTEGRGSCFEVIVFLPRAASTAGFVHTQPDSSIDTLAHGLSGQHVLVVDDNRINQMLLRKWLQQEGAHVEIANNGEQAVERAAGAHFDAILMDVSMPVMNGYDAARAIRAMGGVTGSGHTSGASVPIIGVTALAMGGEREQCQAAGMNDYITKPVDRNGLIRKLVPLIAANEPLPELPEFLPRISLTPTLEAAHS